MKRLISCRDFKRDSRHRQSQGGVRSSIPTRGSDRECVGRVKPLEQETMDNLLSAGFGIGLAAAPKVLGDLFEAIVGAVFVDSGGSLETLWQVRSSSTSRVSTQDCDLFQMERTPHGGEHLLMTSQMFNLSPIASLYLQSLKAATHRVHAAISRGLGFRFKRKH